MILVVVLENGVQLRLGGIHAEVSREVALALAARLRRIGTGARIEVAGIVEELRTERDVTALIAKLEAA